MKAERADRVLSALLGAVVVTAAALVATFGYGRDQGIFAVVAGAIVDGGLPYRDAWDFKPPAIYVVYAVSQVVLGNAPWAIRALEVATLLAGVGLAIQVARRWWGEWRVGLFAGALAALVHAQLDFWHTAQPETFGGVLVLGGLALGADPVRGPGERDAWRYLGAGAVFGLASLLKPPLAAGAAVLAVLAWRAAPLHGRSRWLPAAWLTLGGLAPWAAVLVWLAVGGALPAAWAIFAEFLPHYTALGQEQASLGARLYRAFAEWLLGGSSAMTIGLVLAIAARPWRRFGFALLGGTLAVQLVGVALQGKFFPYHYACCWPATALLSALGWWHLWSWARRHGTLGLSAMLASLAASASLHTATVDVAGSFWSRTAERLASAANGFADAGVLDRLASVADVDGAHNRALAGALQASTPPGTPVYVWGFEPALYALAGRRPASRFIYNVPQRAEWGRAEARAELLGDLQRHAPAAIVVAHRDPLPMVTGDMTDSATSLASFQGLRLLLQERYERTSTVGDFDLYLRAGIGGRP